MDKVRYGIIGIGNMGSGHCKSLDGGLVKDACLTAVCDIKPERLQWAKENLSPSVALFDNDEEFFEKAQIDVVIIAVPHYQHPPLAIEAFRRGLNVITEKPAGVYTKQVREMNEAAAKSGKLFGIMYNQRTNPVYQKVKDLVESGELGEIKRVVWIITSWYRTQSYYNSSSWRATWAGEGGGVLLNQDPHQLDLWQWMCGMPKRVRAFMQYGKGRDIEVENDVTAYVEYPNGATGLFVTSTHETPGTNRLEISADKGKLVVEDDKITFWRNRVGEQEFNANYQQGFGEPECWKCEIPTPGENKQHVGILENYTAALLHKTPLLAPGEEGIKGLSISNAMHLSAWTDSWVELDSLDEELFYQLLKKRADESKFHKVSSEVTLDVTGTH
ncbi:MAG TPA: Gfo/Idh/MocA family oxidoreductase [Candidatus Gallacutalibacter stercoravium]|nr:Gfo/Idh/MocA family oxidoreductase [Candidatus Gallacutalibacter stercoravium]